MFYKKPQSFTETEIILRYKSLSMVMNLMFKVKTGRKGEIKVL